MNKIKILYDVVRKMKDKKAIKGTFMAEGMKDGVKVFSFTNAFERDIQDGQAKGKARMEIDCEGKKMKLENSIDFQGEGCHGHHCLIHRLHSFHNHPHGNYPHRAHPGSLKGGLDRIAAVLGILGSTKLDEKENGTVLTLESADIPEDIKKGIHEKMKQGCEHHPHMDENHRHPMFMKEFHAMESADFTLNVYINKESEIEKAAIEVSGEQKDEKNGRHEMKLTAELCLE